MNIALWFPLLLQNCHSCLFVRLFIAFFFSITTFYLSDFELFIYIYIYEYVANCQNIKFNLIEWGSFFVLKKSAACGKRAEKSGRWAHLNGPDDLIRKLSLMGHMILILVWVLYTQIFLYQVKVNIVISRRKRHRFRISLGKVKAGRRRPQLASLKQRTLYCPKSLPICNGTWPSQAFHTWVFQFSNSHLTLSLFFFEYY